MTKCNVNRERSPGQKTGQEDEKKEKGQAVPQDVKVEQNQPNRKKAKYCKTGDGEKEPKTQRQKNVTGGAKRAAASENKR